MSKDIRHKFPSYPRVYLTTARRKANMSGEALSRNLELSKSYYYAIENGSRGHNLNVALLYKIVECLNADTKEMVESEVRYIEERDIFLSDKIKRIKQIKK